MIRVICETLSRRYGFVCGVSHGGSQWSVVGVVMVVAAVLPASTAVHRASRVVLFFVKGALFDMC